MQLHLQVEDSCSSSHFQMYFGSPQAQHLVDGDHTQNCQAVFWCCSGWPQDLSEGFPISFGNGRCQVQLLSLQSVRFQEEPQRSRSSGVFWCMKAQAKWAHFRDFCDEREATLKQNCFQNCKKRQTKGDGWLSLPSPSGGEKHQAAR